MASPGKAGTTPDKVKNTVNKRTRTLVKVPVLGEFLPGPGEHIELPDKSTVIFAGTILGLAALEVIEWPIAVPVVLGHWLSQQRVKSRALAAVEEAFEEASG